MSQYPAVIDLSDLDGSNGFQISGEVAGDFSGFSVSSAGDVNGDGYSDVIIGSWFADPNGSASGASYVVFGKASGFGTALELSSLDGTNGFQINGELAYDGSGKAVSSAGDVNGDGFGDVIVGACTAGPNGSGSGASYVVFGKASGFGAALELSSLDGSNGFQINGELASDQSGNAVSEAGDVNGDGFDDVIVGAWLAHPNSRTSGAAYVVFGKASGFDAAVELSSLNGSNGFQISGEARDDFLGYAASSAGDVNHDGFADVILGAFKADPNGSYSGATYVVFGKAAGFDATVQPSGLDGSNGFQINGEATNDRSGYSVSSAGDVNGDGIADLIVGAPSANPNGLKSGASYVVFGRTSGFGATLELSSLDGSNGFRINGEWLNGGGPFFREESGFSVSSAGDVNGDGFDDILVGAAYRSNQTNPIQGGPTYVVFGKASGFGANLELSRLDGHDGYQISGPAMRGAGQAVSAAGDVNGDGFADLILGTYGANPNGSNSGASYVIFGSMPGEAVTRAGTDIANKIHGGNFSDTLSGLGGNDKLYAHGGNDDVDGGAGNDTMFFAATDLTSDDTVDGGANNDRIRFTTAGTLTTDVFDNVSHIERIDLDGRAGDDLVNSVTLSDAFVGASDDARHVLRVFGGNRNDTIDASAVTTGANRVYVASGAGNDTVTGGTGADRFSFAASELTSGDTVDGGAGIDRLVFSTAGAIGGFDNVSHVERIDLADGANSLALSDALVGSSDNASHILFVYGNGGADSIDASAVTTRENRVTFNGSGGADVMTAGAGIDRFVYRSAGDSTGAAFDTIVGFNSARDRFDIPGGRAGITGFDDAVTTGTLSAATFDTDLAMAVSGLGAHHALLFTADAGDFAGQTFLVVDLNGTTGYDTGADLVIAINGSTGTLTMADFI